MKKAKWYFLIGVLWFALSPKLVQLNPDLAENMSLLDNLKVAIGLAWVILQVGGSLVIIVGIFFIPLAAGRFFAVLLPQAKHLMNFIGGGLLMVSLFNIASNYNLGITFAVGGYIFLVTLYLLIEPIVISMVEEQQFRRWGD